MGWLGVKKGSRSYIEIGSDQFNILGCGRYPGGDFYVSNDSVVLGLPYHVLLTKNFYYSEIPEGADTKSCFIPAPAEEMTFTLANKSRKTFLQPRMDTVQVTNTPVQPSSMPGAAILCRDGKSKADRTTGRGAAPLTAQG